MQAARLKNRFVHVVVIAVTLSCLTLPAVARDLVIYSSRSEQLIKPLIDRYMAETGLKIEYLTDKEAPLLQRLKAEGKRTPADLLITVDAGNLWQATQMDLLASVDSEVLEENIPAHLKDPENRWFGLSVRARPLIYNTEKVDPATLSTYEALAEEAWADRLCLRTSKKVYNQSLVAMMIAELGAERTEEVVRGWVENLAAQPFASDDEVIAAVAAGRCDVGIVNTYYYGRQRADNPEIPVAIFWPNQGAGERGAHVNVSGAGVVKHAPRPEAALAFLEWLSTGEAQEMFAGLNREYPANPSVDMHPDVAEWGEFRQDLINVSRAGELQADAVRLMDRAGYR